MSYSCTVDMATRFQSSMSLHPAIDQTSHSFEGRFGPTAPRTCSRKTVCSWYVPVCFSHESFLVWWKYSCYIVYLWYAIPKDLCIFHSWLQARQKWSPQSSWSPTGTFCLASSRRRRLQNVDCLVHWKMTWQDTQHKFITMIHMILWYCSWLMMVWCFKVLTLPLNTRYSSCKHPKTLKPLQIHDE